ncbi:uncharacterized protein LOC129231438 [Uloborus diversus]|uniref:uncharacterized protein LOC129231438 n=1 Tax=Uloborus diversus TaxID=327109 RepID=UPI00240A3464|nr:uncharacterized protein LOC129231438 [Uloborus diversus]XP_054721729.1 uncharacterized protein LOC129231438 [Uloborus diversus]
MALLYRFTRVKDRAGTGVFTFIVTRSVTRDFHRDATTKEFTFGYHRWVISFNRSDSKMLGVHLILRNATASTRCYVDYSFCLLNREHFSKNEIFFEKQCRFNADQPAQGPARWILMSELHSRKFSDENGEFLMDLVMSNPLTVYEVDLRMSHLPFGPHHKLSNAETAYFAFGGFEWNIGIHPQGIPEDQETSNRPKILLNRLTGFDHAVRVQYRIVLGDADRVFDSGVLCQMSDVTGRIRGFPLKCTVGDLLRRGILRIYVEMMYANAISEVLIPLQNKDPSDTTPNCYDREKHAWLAEGDIEGECLKLKLFCSDLHHVPRNHLRYVSWNAYVVRSDSGIPSNEKENDMIVVLNAPHWNYYIQEGVDMGIVMETDIPVSLVDEFSDNYKETNKSLTVQIEWLDSLLLFSATYHKYDDIRRLHCHQMKREIMALQTENYSLERQLFSYQKSISMVNSRGQTGDELPNEEPEANNFYERRTLPQGESFPDAKYI